MITADRQLLRFDKKQKYLFWDKETYNTCLVGCGNVPWQVSFLVADLHRNYEILDFYIKWPGKKPPNLEVQKLTGYSQKRMDEQGRPPEEVYPIFQEYLYNPEYIIVGHNLLGFDTYMERILGKIVGKWTDYSYTDRIIDSLNLAKAYRFGKPIDRENFQEWQWKMNTFYTKGKSMKCKLEELAQEFDIEVDSSRVHQADYDIQLNLEVFRKLIWTVEI